MADFTSTERNRIRRRLSLRGGDSDGPSSNRDWSDSQITNLMRFIGSATDPSGSLTRDLTDAQRTKLLRVCGIRARTLTSTPGRDFTDKQLKQLLGVLGCGRR